MAHSSLHVVATRRPAAIRLFWVNLALACAACRPGPPASGPVRAAAPSGAMPGQPKVLASDVTDLAAAASPAVAPALAATEVAWQPGAEGSLLGLRDADFFVDRAAQSLQRQAPALAAEGPLLLIRQVAGATAQDTLTVDVDHAALQTAGVDWLVQRSAAGCVASIGAATAGAPTVPCPEMGDDALSLTAALAAVARPELRRALRVESLQASGDLQLRMAVPAWRLRWQLTIAPDGDLRSIEIPSQGLTLRPYRDEAGWWAAASSSGSNTQWQWRLGRSEARAHTWQVRIPAPGLALDDDRGRRQFSQPLQDAVKQGRASLLGPLTGELRHVDGKWRLVAASAQVLTNARELLEHGQADGVAPGTLLWVKPFGPGAGGATPAQLLAAQSETCLFAGSVAGRQAASEQLFVRACGDRSAPSPATPNRTVPSAERPGVAPTKTR